MDRRIATTALGWIIAMGGLLGACAAAPGPRHTGLQGENLWLGRCGSCHQRPEPERMDRAGWVVTMNRHRRRAALTEAQWSQLIDFLTYRPGVSGGELAASDRRTGPR